MASFTPKAELLIDLTHPVEELEQVITMVINSHPGQQEQILHSLAMSIGRTLSEFQQTKEMQKEPEPSEG